jgi:predicted transcriptional regulator
MPSINRNTLVVHLRQETVHYFTEKEEEFANLLIEIGTKKNVAQLLVFLVNTPEATSREIERGTDLRQPEISIAMKYLGDQGWIRERDTPSESKGRPQKRYSLAVPIKEIFSAIEKEKKAEANHRLEMIRKMREFL